jgi:transposase
MIDDSLYLGHKEDMWQDIPPIQETLAELTEHLRTERSARRRTRLPVLYLLQSGQAQTRQEVARLVAVHRHTSGRWLTVYARAGLRAMLRLQTHSTRAPALPAPVRQALARKLQEPLGFDTYGEVQQWVWQQHGIRVKYKTLHRLVRYQLKAKLKVPRASHVKKTPPRPRSSVPLSAPSSTRPCGRTRH